MQCQPCLLSLHHHHRHRFFIRMYDASTHGVHPSFCDDGDKSSLVASLSSSSTRCLWSSNEKGFGMIMVRSTFMDSFFERKFSKFIGRMTYNWFGSIYWTFRKEFETRSDFVSSLVRLAEFFLLFLRKEGEKEGGSPGWRVMLSVAGSLSPGTILLDVALNTNLELTLAFPYTSPPPPSHLFYSGHLLICSLGWLLGVKKSADGKSNQTQTQRIPRKQQLCFFFFFVFVVLVIIFLHQQQQDQEQTRRGRSSKSFTLAFSIDSPKNSSSHFQRDLYILSEFQFGSFYFTRINPQKSHHNASGMFSFTTSDFLSSLGGGGVGGGRGA
ncbi:hypothetical protein Fcan01_12705 [Folsomia candida]|uniref:Uncharacterized protein n=1 Tax=Folsomia candida TaxID=158441 RepID=A0A226E7R1_FOLCA|nr:hypothetical protein Fcan01_12705 [Folsomia candida]